MNTVSKTLNCSILEFREILLNPEKYDIVGYTEIKKKSENLYILTFGEKNELTMQYTIKPDSEINRIEIEMVNINTFKNIQYFIFDFEINESDQLCVQCNEELMDLEKSHKLFNQLIDHLNLNQEVIISIIKRIEGFIKANG